MRPRVLVIDNYDSFTYNLVQYLGELDSDPIVHRHDALTLDETLELDPDAILISPGPGTPNDAGLSNDVIASLPCFPNKRRTEDNFFNLCNAHMMACNVLLSSRLNNKSINFHELCIFLQLL